MRGDVDWTVFLPRDVDQQTGGDYAAAVDFFDFSVFVA